MAKKIAKGDIIEDNVLNGLIEELRISIGLMNEFDEAVKKTAASTKNAFNGTTAKSMQEANKAVSTSNKLRKDAIAIDKEKVKLNKQLNAATDEEVKGKLRLQRANKKQRDILKDIIILEDQEATIVEKLNARNRQLSRERDKIAGATRKERKAIQALNKQIDANNAKIEQNADKMKKQRLGIGRYTEGVQKALTSVKTLGSALGIVGGIQLFTRGIRNAFNVVKNFDQAQADLSSVLAVNKDEMAALTEQAKELGATTKFTASEVSELQLEFAKLGFTQKEIQAVTESTLQLAAAAGTDLANAATITGSTLRAFGLDANETQRVVDVMAQSFSASSLDIDKFKTAMGAVAPIAKSAGFTIEETTALLGTLTDAGIDAGTAGTGLRNVFLELTKKGLTFEEAMTKISTASDKNAVALDLFGKRGATIGLVLSESGVSIDALTDKLENAGGAAEEMADKQLDTLQGSLQLLNSAWEGYILGADGASGASENLKGIIKFLADNLAAIIDLIIKATLVFGAYKASIKATELASSLLNKRLLVKIKNFRLLGVQVFKNSKMMGLWGAAIAAAVIVAVELFNRVMAVKDANELMNETLEKGNELLEIEKGKLQLVGRELINTKIASEERQAVLDKINAEYGTTLKNLEDEAEFANQVANAYKNIVKQLNQRIKTQVIEEQIAETTRKIMELEKEAADFGVTDIASFAVSTVVGDNVAQQLETQKELLNELNSEWLKLQSTAETPITIETDDPQEGDISADGTMIYKNGKWVPIKKKKLTDQDQLRLKELKEFERTQELKLKAYENFLLRTVDDKEQRDEMLAEKELKLSAETAQKIISLDFETNEILVEHRNKHLKTLQKINKDHLDALEYDIEQSTLDELKEFQDKENEKERLRQLALENEKKRLEELKKANEELTKNLLEGVSQVADSKREELESEIQTNRDEISASQNEIQRLNELGTADAAAAATAQKKAIAKEKIEIEALEKKKRNLLLVTVGLERASQLIGSGDLTPFKNASSDVADFTLDLSSLQSLPAFYNGAEGTFAEVLGATNTRDGHAVRVDDGEQILNGKKVNDLRAVGLRTTTDITNAAIMHQTSQLENKAASASNYMFTDRNIVNKLDSVINAFESMEYPVAYTNPKTGQTTIQKGGHIKRINHDFNPYSS